MDAKTTVDKMKRAGQMLVHRPGSNHNDFFTGEGIMASHDRIASFLNAKPVVGFSGYFVTSDGIVYSTHRGCPKVLKPCKNKDGHLAVRLYSSPKESAQRFIHRLVLESFIGLRPDGTEACHNDGNPSNNNLDNLRWDTRKSNSEDCIQHNRRPRGCDHGRAKITENDVREIIQMVRAGNVKAAIGRRFKISPQQVNQISSGRQWKHLGLVK